MYKYLHIPDIKGSSGLHIGIPESDIFDDKIDSGDVSKTLEIIGNILSSIFG